MIDKEKYNRWAGRYSKSQPFDFSLDMKQYKVGKVGIKRKLVLFASLTKEEFDTFNGWTKKEQLNFLDGYWNFYIAMND